MLTQSIYALPKTLLTNWKNPTRKDLEKAQAYITKNNQGLEKGMFRIRKGRLNSFKIYDPKYRSFDLNILKGTDHLICVMSYCSIGNEYESRQRRLIKNLRSIGFKGDVLYRKGGFPNMESGGILLADVPYAFKIAAFQEAKRLGYKQALWLDTSIHVLVDLQEVFSLIKAHGLYLRKSLHGFYERKLISDCLAESHGVSVNEFNNITHFASGILGMNFEDPRICELLEDWYQLALKKRPFYSEFPEQIPLSFLISKHKLEQTLYEEKNSVLKRDQIGNNTRFFIHI